MRNGVLPFLIFLAFCAQGAAAHAQAPRMLVIRTGDIALGTWTGSGQIIGSSTFCVGYRNNGGPFSVTASGSGASGAFVLSRIPSGGTIGYTLDFADRTGRTVRLSPNVVAPGFSAISINGCRAGPPATDLARISIALSAGDLGAVPSGDYSGTLTLLFEAE